MLPAPGSPDGRTIREDHQSPPSPGQPAGDGARAGVGRFSSFPTDHAIIAVYTTLDDTPEVWDLIPMMEFLIENTTDPNRISSQVTGVYKFRVGVRRSGSTDTITSADMSLRRDGVNA